MAKNGEEKELAFKHHVQEFTDVSHEIRDISERGMMAKLRVGYLTTFYETVCYLNRIYSPYLRNPEKIKKILSNIDKKVYDEKYYMLLDRYNKTPRPDIRVKIKKYENSILNILNDIVEEMSGDFVDCELRPKPTIKPKKYSETLDDEVQKLIYEDLEEIGM